MAAVHQGEVHANPGPEYEIAGGDMLALLGDLSQRTAARKILEENTFVTRAGADPSKTAGFKE